MGKSKVAAGSVAVPKRNKASLGTHIVAHRWLYIMLIPGLLYYIIFHYVPMFGIIIAFENFNPMVGKSPIEAYLQSPWVGLAQFQKFFGGPDFMRLLKNTLGISILNLVIGFPAPIILALFLNELRSQTYKRVAQTFVYVPHFISWVIVGSLTYQLFNISDGFVYHTIESIFGSAPDILSKPQYFKGMIVGQGLWKETGYGTIVFLAALSGVDTELYEAARVDGAGRWRLMWHITLPAIRGTIVIMLIMRVGALLNTGYEQIFMMENDLNRSAAQVFDTYIYRVGIKQGQYSLATAAGLFKSIVSMILVLGTNWIAKRCGESGLY